MENTKRFTIFKNLVKRKLQTDHNKYFICIYMNHITIAKKLGFDVRGAFLLEHYIYLQDINPNQYFYTCRDYISNELTINKKIQSKMNAILVEKGILSVKRRMNASNLYKLNYDKFKSYIEETIGLELVQYIESNVEVVKNIEEHIKEDYKNDNSLDELESSYIYIMDVLHDDSNCEYDINIFKDILLYMNKNFSDEDIFLKFETLLYSAYEVEKTSNIEILFNNIKKITELA